MTYLNVLMIGSIFVFLAGIFAYILAFALFMNKVAETAEVPAKIKAINSKPSWIIAATIMVLFLVLGLAKGL